jgi:hypothetical protein
VRLRDLGSLNGTHVNGARHGGRARNETPEEGGQSAHAEVDLRDGDRIRVGATIITVGIEAPAACCDCGRPIGEGEREAAAWIAGTFLCDECRLRSGASGHAAASVRPLAKARAPRAAVTAEGRAGGSFGDYEVGPLLGKGGMGAVYRARRKSDGREVALKLLLPKVVVSPETRANLLREIEVTRRLRHANIVEMIECGEDGEGFYFALEYCPGGSVEARVQLEGGLPLGIAAPFALQIADRRLALEVSVIHRLAARLTRKSIDTLQLKPGREVYAVIKSVALDRDALGRAPTPLERTSADASTSQA